MHLCITNDHGIVGVVLTITAVSPGAVDYLVNGSGCAHDASPAGPSAGRTADAVGYLLGEAGEPAGVWFGEGLALVDARAGEAATAEAVRAVFGRLEHPTHVDERGKPVGLGSRPRSFRSRERRKVDALAAEPDATEERRAEIRREVIARTRTPVAYYDLTFSAAKSVSVYWTGLLAAGREAEAAGVVAAHRAGVAAAMAYVEREAASVRSGYHGRMVSGESVGVYEPARGLVWIRWDHSTSRARQPHLHSHVTVLNRAETVSDGVVRALASRGFGPIKQGADAIYRTVLQQQLAASNGVVFATRPDGKAEEILGFAPELLAKASARHVAVVARRDALVTAFADRHGRPPSPAERKRLDRIAWRETRHAKDHAVAPRRQLDTWAAGVGDELHEALAVAEAQAARVAIDGHPDQHGHLGRSREQVLRAAIAGVQARFATWEVGNLVAEIAAEQRRTPAVAEPAEVLAAKVLAHGDRYGIRRLSVRDVGEVPAALRRPDGASWFRLANAGRYATDDQLATEARIVDRARRGGAVTVSRLARVVIGAELVAAGLSVGQQDAVLHVVSSGRCGDVLIGPAGAGKSRTVGMLARVWQAHVGGRVLGLATSQIATRVLADDGLAAMNTTVFRHRFIPDGRGRVADRLTDRDLVVVDEAGMSGTPELDVISAVVAAAGAKLVYTGDHEQLRAVGAGGMLELLVRDAGAVELAEVHRFTHEWERAASVRLRAGDPDVLAVYDAHGRIRGGTEEDMAAAAVRGYLADTLDGLRSLLVVRDNATAAELSGQVRAELIAAGRVSPQVLAATRDGNLIGVGDRVQARRNAPHLTVDGAGMVTNREVYDVLGPDPVTGALRVRDGGGVVAHLPAGYVRDHVTLAYAVTAHGAQGLNVDTTHDLIDGATDRPGVYVPGTRGRNANTFYVTCQTTPDHHDPRSRDSTPLAVLAAAVTRPLDTTAAAELQRRAGDEETRSLAWVGTQWDLLTALRSRDHATDVLVALLGPDAVERAVAEAGYGRLMSAVRRLELAGHDPDRVLHDAVARGSLHDATSLSDVLRYRLRLLENYGRIPERTVRLGDWATLTPPTWNGPVGDYVRVLAAAASDRQTELGERVIADPPPWALAAPALGPVPAAGRERVEWVRRAGTVAAYRDLHAIPDTQPSLGAAPSREREFHHTLWRHAQAALGHPADTLDYTTATDTELRDMRDAWRRTQTWAPPYVAEDLHDARQLAEDHRRDAVIWRAGLDRHPPGSPEHERDARDVDATEHLAAVYAARVDALERLQNARTDWVDRTREQQERAAFAGDELERRGLDRDTAAPVVDQHELFPVADVEHTLAMPGEGGHASTTSATSPTAEVTGYAIVFADAERVADRDRHQPGLFDAEPAPGDIAAAQPLHADTGHARRGSVSSGPSPNESASDEPEVTTGQATRQAEARARLRAQIDARSAAAAERLRSHRGDPNEDNEEDHGSAYGYSDDAYSSDTEQAGQGYGVST